MMKGKTELLTNFNFFNPNGRNVAERNSKPIQFFS
jgi:hypothetical protein